MFEKQISQFKSPFSPDECHQRLEDAGTDWELSDNQDFSFSGGLQTIGDRLYIAGSRRRPGGYGRSSVPALAWCRVILTAFGTGTQVSLDFGAPALYKFLAALFV